MFTFASKLNYQDSEQKEKEVLVVYRCFCVYQCICCITKQIRKRHVIFKNHSIVLNSVISIISYHMFLINQEQMVADSNYNLSY